MFLPILNGGGRVFWHPRYSGTNLICMAYEQKNPGNYLSMWIIQAFYMLSNIMLWRVVSQTIIQIIWEVQISEGQIIGVTL